MVAIMYKGKTEIYIVSYLSTDLSVSSFGFRIYDWSTIIICSTQLRADYA
jgi:hypothetical protein